MKFTGAAVACIGLVTACQCFAGVDDPTIATDHPIYPGEGRFQTVEDCVQFAALNLDSNAPQERAIALYLWLLTHQYHLASPQEACFAGAVPDTAGGDDLVVYDANRARFSYGYGLCGTVHAWNEPYWRALGMVARRRAFPGHVNSEVFYDGGWHAFDTDMAGLVFRRDGVVAGYDDIAADLTLADSFRPPLPHYPFAWPSDRDVMRSGWEEVARGGNWYAMYNSGYAAHPGIVQLRRGETFTRWFDRDHYGGPSKRRFWHNLDGGPFRNWTFVNAGLPRHEGDAANARGNASYCNGEFEYQPDLSTDAWHDGAGAIEGLVEQRETSPRLHSSRGAPVSVTFSHFSPYVICGDPEDDANPMTGPATGGLVVSANVVGDVRWEVSGDEGQTWTKFTPAHAASSGNGQAVTQDLTDFVKGRYGWQVRLSWSGAAGVDRLRFVTVTQVAQAIYPRLKADGTQITYRCGSRGVVTVLPLFRSDDAEQERGEVESLRSPNVRYHGRTATSRLAYEWTGRKEGHVVFRIPSTQPLSKVTAAVRYQIRVPPLEGFSCELQCSTNGGVTWATFAAADVPADNEFSSGWLAGETELSGDGLREALVRVVLNGQGTQTGIIAAQFYGITDSSARDGLIVTHSWNDNGAAREHTETIPAGTREHRYRVPTGVTLTDSFVRMSVP